MNDEKGTEGLGHRGCALAMLYVLAFIVVLLGGWYVLTIIAYRRADHIPTMPLIPTEAICVYSILLVLVFAWIGSRLGPWTEWKRASTAKTPPPEARE